VSAEFYDVKSENGFRLISYGKGIHIQHHKPEAMQQPYHVHASMEINHLEGCDLVYSFSGQPVRVPKNHFCVFWAARPHRPIDIIGEGSITNAYVSLEEFWDWMLPREFTDLLLNGAVLIAKKPLDGDTSLTKRWAQERNIVDPQITRLHCLELQARLTRMSRDGWTEALPPTRVGNSNRIGGNAIAHFERMLRFIAMNSLNTINLTDIANSASVSKNYANTLFKRILGTTVKVHITEIRVHRAKTLLAETDEKILNVALDCGFRSLSAFYEAFQASTGKTPALFRANVREEKQKLKIRQLAASV
jgi:AraC-like DNA-binding protein